jgi:UDP-N-acetylglucosamine 2-epimerase (non-hydrolysing)
MTGQHVQLAAPFVRLFDFQPKYSLKAMVAGQTVAALSRRLFASLPPILEAERPQAVVVQGDTTSALIGAFVAFYTRIPIAHVEAGLRSGSIVAPFPEEGNRRMMSVISSYHYAPTVLAQRNLMAEGVPSRAIKVTGNTGIDTLRSLWRARPKQPAGGPLGTITVTAHRRENWGAGLDSICRAVRTIAAAVPERHVVWPVHPGVRAQVRSHLQGASNVRLLGPQPYDAFVELLSKSYIVLTDSGGIQEEATALGLPVLILRERTERPEVLSAGNGILVGTDERKIVSTALRLLQQPKEYRRHAKRSRVFGDGRAGERIAKDLIMRIRAQGT